MPVISRFYGVTIKMYFDQSEHNPPHFHAIYGEYIGAIDIQTGEMLEGDLPKRVQRLVNEWLALHRDALLNIWKTQCFEKLPPLE